MSPLIEHLLEIEADLAQSNAIMDSLQNAGVVSDNSVTPGDVYESDAVRAVEWLRTADRITMDSTGKYARLSL